MSFHIRGLEPATFRPLFDHTDDELARRGIRRRIVDAEPGYPCRISLAHARVGEHVLLLPYAHLVSTSPYQAAGPIYIRRDAAQFAATDTLPDCLVRARVLSLRGYDASDLMIAAEVLQPSDLVARITATFADPAVAYLHLHNAGPGCFSCRVDRA